MFRVLPPPNSGQPDRHAHARSMLSLLTSVKAALWDEAPAEQRKLTLQLGRNSLYFATAVFFIKQLGEQVAVWRGYLRMVPPCQSQFARYRFPRILPGYSR